MEKNNSEGKKVSAVKFREIAIKENIDKKSDGERKTVQPRRVVKLAPPEQEVTLPVMPPEYNKKIHGEIVKE